MKAEDNGGVGRAPHLLFPCPRAGGAFRVAVAPCCGLHAGSEALRSVTSPLLHVCSDTYLPSLLQGFCNLGAATQQTLCCFKRTDPTRSHSRVKAALQTRIREYRLKEVPKQSQESAFGMCSVTVVPGGITGVPVHCVFICAVSTTCPWF